NVVIIGAGMAGLSAARALRDQDIDPLVLERAPEIGGRCATRTHEKGIFDLGAQFFTVRRPEFHDIADSWIASGKAREWTRGFPEISGVSELASHPRYCGANGMCTLADALAKDMQVRLNTPVKRISEGRSCWLIEIKQGKRIKADIVLLTPPPPAALRLISDENTWRMGALLLPLTGVEYIPHFAAAAVLDGPSQLPAPGAARVDDPTISWIADNQQKGISPNTPAITLHATREFAKTHQGTPIKEAGELLAQAAAPFLKNKIISLYPRRWRYGTPENTLQQDFYFVEGRAPLYFAGDAFCGGLVEGATLSGFAAGKAIAKRLHLSNKPVGQP
ncbi:MAG: FAD-dependent oxidoreductase, partial [Candidatus Hydrogenedentes bacterium]|nr:FAD-dependent oxidoreductase [Candidatus Hydrogenedentota bacterium]